MTLSNLLCEIMNNELCPGLPLAPKAMQGDKVISHVIPCHIDLKSQQHLLVSTKMFSRDERCVVFVWMVIYAVNVDHGSNKSKPKNQM